MNDRYAAWVIGHVSVKDAAKWDRYRHSVPATVAPFKGELLLRGVVTDVLHGAHTHTDSVVLGFPDLDAARNWHASAAYQALIPLRTEAADVDLIIVAA